MDARTTSLALLVGLALVGCRNSRSGGQRAWDSSDDALVPPALEQEDGDDGEDERLVAAADISANVRRAALAAVPGLDFREAEPEEAGSVHCVHGAVGGVLTEVEVSRDGDSIGVESGDDEGEDLRADDEDEDFEEDVPLASVPQAAKDAALAAVPGLVLFGAEKEVEDGRPLYCLQGVANGRDYEVEVTADGEVVEVESGDDD